MDIHQLNEWSKRPELMGYESLAELRSLLLRYPYFQTAWVLYLKNLYLLKHQSFKDELRRGALYVADLSVLFYYIEGEKYSVSGDRNEVSSGKPLAADRTLDLIDRFLSEIPNDKAMSPELSVPVDTIVDYSSLLFLNSDSNNESEEEIIPLKGQDLIDKFIKKVENNQSASSNDGIIRETLGDNDSSEEYCDDIMDFEIYNNECETDSSSSFGEDSSKGGEEDYLTETLAKIYVKQQRYDKALEIIKKLNLKYPKKNIYFADQIRFLERLIINTKSK